MAFLLEVRPQVVAGVVAGVAGPGCSQVAQQVADQPKNQRAERLLDPGRPKKSVSPRCYPRAPSSTEGDEEECCEGYDETRRKSHNRFERYFHGLLPILGGHLDMYLCIVDEGEALE